MSLPVRHTDPDTSRIAAADAVTRRATVRAAVLKLLQQGPMTHDDLIAALPQFSPSGVRTRVSELVTDGEVEMVTDRYSKTATGRKARLWQIKTRETLW